MPKLNRTSELVENVEQGIDKPMEKSVPIRFDKVLSTGSTLLDLAISGDKIHGGGIPGGILMEISGIPMAGKTALLMEMLGSCQYHGGDYHISDPEGRIDEEYVGIYGVQMDKTKYDRPDTVSQSFGHLNLWNPQPEKEDAISVYAEDSLAALSTNMEMEEEDKRGQRRAKEFSEGCRKVCRKIANKRWMVVATNQVREDTRGFKTTGGWAVPFYSSLRISVKPSWPKGEIEKAIKINGKDIKQTIGVRSTCSIIKSSVSIPFRTADVFIVFNVGIDDIRGNLQWLKDIQGLTSYWAVTKTCHSMDQAITHIEKESLEESLREQVIKTWEEIQEKFRIERKPKVRW